MVEKVDYQAFEDDTTDFVRRLKRVTADIALRLARLEDREGRVDHAVRDLEALGLARINDGLQPLIDQAAALVADAEAAFAALQAEEDIATLADITAAIDALKDGVASERDTLTELSAALDAANAAITANTVSLANKATVGHSHIIGNVTGLQSELDGKAAAGHDHPIGDVTGLQAALDGKAAANAVGAVKIHQIQHWFENVQYTTSSTSYVDAGDALKEVAPNNANTKLALFFTSEFSTSAGSNDASCWISLSRFDGAAMQDEEDAAYARVGIESSGGANKTPYGTAAFMRVLTNGQKRSDTGVWSFRPRIKKMTRDPHLNRYQIIAVEFE